jgi:TonB family protein
LEQDIVHLRKKLAKKQSNRKVVWWQIAAVVSLLMVSGIVLWSVSDMLNEDHEIAQNLEQDAEEVIEPPIAQEEAVITDENFKPEITEPIEEEEQVSPKPRAAKMKTSQKSAPLPVAVVDEVVIDYRPDEVETTKEGIVEDLPLAEEAFVEEIDISESMELSEVVFEDLDIQRSKIAAVSDPSSQDSMNIKMNLLTGRTTGIVVEKSNARSVARSASSVSRRVYGVVRDAEGKETLPGVTVIVVGTARGTVTDYDGRFELELQPEDSVISFHFIGMQDLEQPIASNMEILMEPDVASLSEVVVTAYGVEDRSNSTGAVTKVDLDDNDGASYQNAQPVGGMSAFKEYVELNLKYPEKAKSNQISGTVKLKLDISVSGKVSNIEVKKSLGYGCDNEAIRLVNEGPNWQPAERDGVPIESSVTIRVRFK